MISVYNRRGFGQTLKLTAISEARILLNHLMQKHGLIELIGSDRQSEVGNILRQLRQFVRGEGGPRSGNRGPALPLHGTAENL